MTYGRRHYLVQQFLVFLAYAGPTGSETREFLKASARFLISLALIFCGLVAIANGQEQPQGTARSEAAASPDGATSGEFLYRSDHDAQYLIAPTVETRVRFDVTGVIARATVIQRFRNPSEAWIEGVYVFPLPEASAVDHLKMRAGDRLIVGEIREKEQARREFDQAAAEGKKATLIEQHRPNLFKSRVANLGPLEELEVEIEYQQTLRFEEEKVSLRFPLTFTPRYRPPPPFSSIRLARNQAALLPVRNGTDAPTSQDRGLFDGDDETGSGNASPGCGPGIDALFLQPPWAAPSSDGPMVSIDLLLNAGFEVASVTSRTHELLVEPESEHLIHVSLEAGQVPADRDFEVSWRPTPGVMPRSQITSEAGPDGTYALVSLFPPTGGQARGARMPREVTFVIDTSGSMEGVSMEQAKRALQLAITRLDPEDSFNLIEFNSRTTVLFPRPVPATPTNRHQAAAYAASLRAQGGTDMMPALLAALSAGGHAEERSDAGPILRQVIFLTDGAVSNEDQLFAAIQARLGPARLFTVGIGPAPNSHFMTKAAEFGRGTFTFISDAAEVETQMSELYARVESPVLTDVQVSFDDVSPESAEIWPARVPDLYLGEPVIVAARFAELPSAIRVTGRLDGEPFESLEPLSRAQKGRGINVLWARRKIQSLLDGVHEGNDPEAVRAQVVSLGLTHHLVTRHTSLVAVDLTPSRPAGERLEESAVPLLPPSGSAFGALPVSATPSTFLFLQALAAWAVAASILLLAKRA